MGYNRRLKEMSNKYYHNDYKKMMGVDQTRTASEKLLDRALGVRTAVIVPSEQPTQKKVKQQQSSLTPIEVLSKLIKNIDNNHSAVKLAKPLTILKKCLNDYTFANHPQINTLEQWKSLSKKILEADDKLVGNYSEINVVIELLTEILSEILLKVCKFKPENNEEEVKIEEKQQLSQQAKNTQPKVQINLQELNSLIQTLELHLMYLKMYTDDSFTFNKLLSDFKLRFLKHFSSTQSSPISLYLQSLLMRLFNLPHTKYEWIRQSLSQFFRLFNIQHKHTLSETVQTTYLRAYNSFLTPRNVKSAVQGINPFGSSSNGRIQVLEVSSNDGIDKWTTKQ